MKKIKFLSNKYIKSSLLVVSGLLLGWLFFHQSLPTEKYDQSAVHEHSDDEEAIWTCAMHPQIRMDKPGKCPICGMDLIPLQKSNVEIEDQAIAMSESAMKLAEVQTSIVGKGNATKEVLLYGKIQPDEKLLQSQTAHVPGRIEQLFINVTGEAVKKGQLVAKIYSPELITAQKELLEALTMGDKYPAIPEAAREKLRNWKLSEQQIHDIEKLGKVTSTFDIYANTSGIVTSRKVNEGDYLSKGAVLFDVADLSRVWAIFDAYESDLPWISFGQKVEFTVQALPGRTFDSKVSFIDPVIDPLTRTARVRAELSNPGSQLKPEMFINGNVHSILKVTGQQITIPKSAVLWTGTRSIVYVKIPGTEHPSFKMREVTLGASTKDLYIILDGLKTGEEIVTNGAFSVDAAAQLAGKPSMMNPEGGKTSTGHNHGGMEMGGESMDDPSVHQEKDMNAEKAQGNASHNKVYTESKKLEINLLFKKQLTTVYHAYIPMKNAFVNSSPQEVVQFAGKVNKALDGVDMKLLEGKAHMDWMNQLGILEESLGKMVKNQDIRIQREAFAIFNTALYKSFKQFGLNNILTYYQYCPMAFGDKGAYWLSESKEIANPYFGDEMLKCGETRDELHFK